MGKPKKQSESTENTGRASDQAFGRVLRALRNEKGLTQEEVAWETGMSRVYISETERGLREPSLTTVLRLSKVLGVTGAEMIAAVEKELG